MNRLVFIAGVMVGAAAAVLATRLACSIPSPVSKTRTIGDDSFDDFIEVRSFSGPSCSIWTLTVEARNCS